MSNYRTLEICWRERLKRQRCVNDRRSREGRLRFWTITFRFFFETPSWSPSQDCVEQYRGVWVEIAWLLETVLVWSYLCFVLWMSLAFNWFNFIVRIEFVILMISTGDYGFFFLVCIDSTSYCLSLAKFLVRFSSIIKSSAPVCAIAESGVVPCRRVLQPSGSPVRAF